MSYPRRGTFRGNPRRASQQNFQTMQERGQGEASISRQQSQQYSSPQQSLRQQAEKYLQNQKPPVQTKPSVPVKQDPAPMKPTIIPKVEAPPPPIISAPTQATNGDSAPTQATKSNSAPSQATNSDTAPAQAIKSESAPPPAAAPTDTPPKEKPAWVKGSGKINKKELRRRRNLRLRKMLQPKNALMVLNELVGSTVYDVVESPDLFSGAIFRCTVKVDGIDHVGLGKSKPAAKNAAAETALKYLVLSKVNRSGIDASGTTQEGGENETKMEIDENSDDLSWSHVACYALHKLLSGWDEGVNLNLAEKVAQVSNNVSGGNDTTDSGKGRIIEKKPAKKLPDNASEMNPVMLLNQMVPHAVYEEISKEGNPPNVNFTVKCTIGNDAFLGTASTKKGARKACAFAACRQLLNIQYAPSFLQEHNFSEDSVRTVLGSSAQSA